jgi:hypothetical protein
MATIIDLDGKTHTLSDGLDTELKITIRKRHWDGARDWHKTARVYVSHSEDLGPVPPYGSKRGDGSDGDKAWKAYNKAELAASRRVIDRSDGWIKVLCGLDLDADVTYKFSRKAGCSCPCSPGFVASRYLMLDGTPVDVWVQG